MKNTAEIKKDLANKRLNITRAFNAPVEKVWKAWTTAELLDKWWAPRPWRTETKSMDFKVGGVWLYSMVGPEGERHYCRVDYTAINAPQSFSNSTNFCDEDGNVNDSFPIMYLANEFKATETGSVVEVTVSFDSEADLAQIVSLGFEQGFTMALGNLEELLEV